MKTPSPEFTLFSHSVPNDTFYNMVMLGERYGGKAAERAGIVQMACGADELATLLEIRLKNDARRVVDLRPASALDAPASVRDAVAWLVDAARERVAPAAA